MHHYVRLFDAQYSIYLCLSYLLHYLDLFLKINVVDLRRMDYRIYGDNEDRLKILHNIIHMILCVL